MRLLRRDAPYRPVISRWVAVWVAVRAIVAVRKNGAVAFKDAADLNKGFEAMTALAGNVKVNSQELYGVLHEDKTGCYWGGIQKLKINNSKVKNLFIIQGITVVKGKALVFCDARSLGSASAIQAQLGAVRSTIAATLAQN